MLYNRSVKCIMLVLSQMSFIEFILQTNLLDVVCLSSLHYKICPKDLHKTLPKSPETNTCRSRGEDKYRLYIYSYICSLCISPIYWQRWNLCQTSVNTDIFNLTLVACTFLESNTTCVPVRLGITYLLLAATCRF